MTTIQTHNIKIKQQYADAVLCGDKTFEVRYNDRGYQKNDRVIFTVVDDAGIKIFTHPLNEKEYEITYLIHGFGLGKDWCVFWNQGGHRAMTKTNPRRRPATEADVRKAWEEGVNVGVRNAAALILTVLVDKYGMAEQIPEVWQQICKLSEEVAEGLISFADLRHVLKEEYSIDL